MSNNKPIGFLDSGVGGLTVIKEAMKQLPNEMIYYIGDTLRCPYGPRPIEEIRQFTWELTNFLLEKKIKVLVIACNTATAIALNEIKERINIPVIGVIVPGAKAALRATNNHKIGVIGTSGTIQSKAYEIAIQNKSPESTLYGLACPKFVPIVESMEYNSEIAKMVVDETLDAFKGKEIDTLVLGCTHYPLLRPFIQKKMGNNVRLIDSGAETVSELKALLAHYNLFADTTEKVNQSIFFTTGSKPLFEEICRDWLTGQNFSVERVTLN